MIFYLKIINLQNFPVQLFKFQIRKIKNAVFLHVMPSGKVKVDKYYYRRKDKDNLCKI
jgi:hypothetical protein